MTQRIATLDSEGRPACVAAVVRLKEAEEGAIEVLVTVVMKNSSSIGAENLRAVVAAEGDPGGGITRPEEAGVAEEAEGAEEECLMLRRPLVMLEWRVLVAREEVRQRVRPQLLQVVRLVGARDSLAVLIHGRLLEVVVAEQQKSLKKKQGEGRSRMLSRTQVSDDQVSCLLWWSDKFGSYQLCHCKRRLLYFPTL